MGNLALSRAVFCHGYIETKFGACRRDLLVRVFCLLSGRCCLVCRYWKRFRFFPLDNSCRNTKTRPQASTHYVLPMAYMVVYVYFHAVFGNHKEVCLALVVFVCAASHALRTVLGLWQLHVFKHWAVRSICSLESLGNRTLQSEREEGTESFRERSPAKRKGQALIVSENIIVNSTIVET